MGRVSPGAGPTESQPSGPDLGPAADGQASVIAATPGSIEWWRRLRDRLFASPRFQARAAAFPLTRPIARRNARSLFDLCAGFVYSQVLAACISLDLFVRLAAGPQTSEQLASQSSMPAAGMERLLKAAVALGLLQRRQGGRYGLGPHGAALLGNPGIAAMVAHHDRLYRDLADPVALLRGERGDGALGDYWPYATADAPSALGADAVARYSALMAASLPFVANEVLAGFPFRRFRHLLDVGGGEGRFVEMVGARYAHLQLGLVDLPAVTERARTRLAGTGLSARLHLHPADMVRDPLPAGADLITLIRILHDHDDDSVRAILARVRDALPPGGTVLIAEPMAGTRDAEPVGDAYFGMYLWAMGQGRARTPAELKAMLAQAGLVRPRLRATRMPLLARMLEARKPA